MTRETVEEKAARYLTQGRLIVSRAGPGHVDAECRGDGEIYRLGYRRGWWCTCPARGRCAHLTALGLVTAPTTEPYARQAPAT